jgi:hypothetical protein
MTDEPSGKESFASGFGQRAKIENSRTFLLSPASSNGRRAQILIRPEARFELAEELRSKEGAPIGEVFAFLSGLYFRGKLTYARAFAEYAYVITPCLGLVPLDERIDVDTIRRFAEIDIHHEDERFSEPLVRDARRIDEEDGGRGEVVLLGSIASKKYVEILGSVFGERLLFPASFVGRGDMSRGGLMLRAARDGSELEYASVLGSVRKGKRPPKLTPVKGILRTATKRN